MPGRYERVCVGWHCAKVKGRAELKIEKPRAKTYIYDFPELHHSSPNSFGANVHALTPIFPKKSKGRQRSPCAPNMVQFRPLFPELQHFGGKMAHAIFFRSAAILKVLVRPNWVRTCPSPEWKKVDMRILEQFRLFFFSYRGHNTSWHIRAREEVKGQMEL